ncbi:MAG: hypothetical protein ABJF88_08260 [Rhodothermales bacterium]
MSEPRAERTRTLLQEAAAHLRQAERYLVATPPDYAAALADMLAIFRTSLRAFLTWTDSSEVDGEADLHALAVRAGHLASILKTPAHRALLLAERAPAIEQSIRRSDRLSVADREDVETGWYTARNLYQTVLGNVPASLRPTGRRSAPARPERGEVSA